MMNPMDMSQRHVLVTGASSGIGRATCILLSQLGAKVTLVARREGALHETLEQMTGSDHVIVPFDLSQVDDIPALLRDLTKTSGKLDGLVHGAGFQRLKTLRDITNESIQDTMIINLNSAFGLIKGFRHKQVHTKNSSIVLLSSVAAYKGTPGNTVYSASKGATIALVRSAALELARQSIRVNSVAPGFVHTEMSHEVESTLSDTQLKTIVEQHPLGLGSVEDVAHSIVFLLSHAAQWITGTNLVVDGGYTA